MKLRVASVKGNSVGEGGGVEHHEEGEAWEGIVEEEYAKISTTRKGVKKAAKHHRENSMK